MPPPDEINVIRLSEQLTRLADQVAKGIETISGPIVTEVRTNSIVVGNLQGVVQNLSKDMKETFHTVNLQNLKLGSIEKDVEQIKAWVETQEDETRERQKEVTKQQEDQRAMRQRTYLTIGIVVLGYLIQLFVWLVDRKAAIK